MGSLGRALVDPTVLFAISVLLIGPLRDSKDKKAALVEAVTDKTFLAVMGLLVLVLVWVHKLGKKTVKLSAADERVANWYLVNAIVFHTLADCLVGTFHLYPTLDRQYKILDGRFRDDGAVPAIIGLMEMFFMAPVCILIYRAYHQQLAYRHELELVIGGIHAFGAYMFVADEVWNGQKNLHADWDFSFDEKEILYYWFGTWFANSVWVVMPAYLMFRAYRNIQKQKVKASKSS